MTVEHAGSTTNDVVIPDILVRAPGKAYSSREDVLKISYGSESCHVPKRLILTSTHVASYDTAWILAGTFEPCLAKAGRGCTRRGPRRAVLVHDVSLHCAWDERFEHPARTWASASHRAFTLQATRVAMANATYEFMRANATEEMRRVLGAKAANVQLAVPPTLAAGDWSVDSEGDGEGSSVDLHDGVSESDDNN